MSQKTIDWKTGVVSTVGATTSTVCDTDAIPTGANVTVDGFLQGRDAAGLMASTYIHHRGSNVGGVLGLIGTLTSLVTFATGSDAVLATAVAAIVVTGTQLRLQVTGVATKTIEWFGDLRVRIN